jgi:AICAR transformylase/IMP cyclohydrolase PurH
MRKAFRHTAEYDTAIADHFAAVPPAQVRAAYAFQS